MADKYANIAALTEFLSQIKAWANATFSPKFVILSYGNSTWADYIDAYSNNKVVYCRASSGSNPASGSQTRLAFMAYVNNAEAPTEVEFQYYRSVNSHSASQQGDQVFVYKLTKTGGWTVTTREAMSKIATEKGLDSTYSSGTIKLKTKLKAESQSSLTAADKGSTANREYAVGLDASGNLSVNVPWEDTQYESKTASSGGTDVSLVTTGEKYTWNSKADGTHTHTKDQITDLPAIPTGTSTTIVNSISAVGSLPTLTFTPDASTGNLTIAWSQGTLPTKGSDTTVATGLTYSAQDIWNGGNY